MFFRSVTANRRANFTVIVVVWRLEFRKDFCNFPCTQREKWPKLDYSKSHVQLQMNTDKHCSKPPPSMAELRVPDSGLKQREARRKSGPQNLCSSVFICGCLELARPSPKPESAGNNLGAQQPVGTQPPPLQIGEAQTLRHRSRSGAGDCSARVAPAQNHWRVEERDALCQALQQE